MGFTAWNTEVMNRLKTGSIKNVIYFGDSKDKLPIPYVVLKSMAGGNRKTLQIIVHNVLGTQDLLEAYILRELPSLFKEPLVSGEEAITVRETGSWFGPYIDEYDDTLTMSRDFYIPVVL